MAKFAYNNTKNASTGYMPFELNCGYYSCIFFEEDINLYPQLKSADKLLAELQDLMTICQENLTTLKSFRNKLTIKALSLKAMPFSNKIWLNSKYIKTK